MKIGIQNFGPIREFTIDLKKDFHLFVGANNIGKSYAITTVYLIIKNLLEGPLANRFGENRYFWDNSTSHDAIYQSAIPIMTQAKNLESKIELVVTEKIVTDLKNVLEIFFIPNLTNSFLNTFSSLDNLANRYSNDQPKITIEDSVLSFDVIFDASKLSISNIQTQKKFVVKKIKQNREPHDSENKCTIYFFPVSPRSFIYRYSSAVLNNVYGFFNRFKSIIQSVHYLPASRSGLYQALSAFGQIVAELSKNRAFLTKKIELPGISEPLSDYFIKLSDIRITKKKPDNKAINFIAKLIETEILKGQVEFNPQTKQLMFYPNKTNLKLELSTTSSMVSELAPIVSYLRYVLSQTEKEPRRPVQKNSSHLILIEEPEAHLHPEIQIILTQIFSKLVAANIKLIITSHSNYIFNKVNNLIMSKDLSLVSTNSSVFKQTNKGSVLNSLVVNELGIEDDNFTDATSRLFEEKLGIIDELNSTIVEGKV